MAESVAPTKTAYLLFRAANLSPSLPALMNTRPPLLFTLLAARRTVLSEANGAKLTLNTLAPWSAAQINPAAMLRDEARIDVVAREPHLDATDERIYDYPILFMTGHHHFEVSDDQIKALRKYLLRGGVLVADACCGRPAFDKGFRDALAWVCRMDPGSQKQFFVDLEEKAAEREAKKTERANAKAAKEGKSAPTLADLLK